LESAKGFILINLEYSSLNASKEIEIEAGQTHVAIYPDIFYLTIFGELSWFRGDFNISYRYINMPGPDGNITDPS
jgi:hypothetical protein